MKKHVAKSILFLFFCLSISIAQAGKCKDKGSILSVKTTKNGRSEYIIFTIKKPLSYRGTLSTVKDPTTVTDPSGQPVDVKGCKYKMILFKDINWTCEFPESFLSNMTMLQGIKKVEQFEGVVSYLFAYNCIYYPVVTQYSYAVNSTTIKYVIRIKR